MFTEPKLRVLPSPRTVIVDVDVVSGAIKWSVDAYLFCTLKQKPAELEESKCGAK